MKTAFPADARASRWDGDRPLGCGAAPADDLPFFLKNQSQVEALHLDPFPADLISPVSLGEEAGANGDAILANPGVDLCGLGMRGRAHGEHHDVAGRIDEVVGGARPRHRLAGNRSLPPDDFHPERPELRAEGLVLGRVANRVQVAGHRVAEPAKEAESKLDEEWPRYDAFAHGSWAV